ncbi:MAG TPA: sigma-70 family RNA polymerase sigma factor [Polyangia bacterium]|nr:sigma-70 family RNA polymerase sigma factor [Polyangia bacterium]
MPSPARKTAPPAHDARARPAAAEFDDIYDRTVDYVWNVVRRMGVPPSDAEDVVQEVFVAVHRRLDRFEGRAQLKTWVFSIAVHFVQHYFRTHFRKPGDRATGKGTEIHALADQQENGPASEVERMERYDALDWVLARLDEPKRLVFVLAELEQMTLSEIGEIVGANPNTVATRLRAARQAFEKALARFQARELGRREP